MMALAENQITLAIVSDGAGGEVEFIIGTQTEETSAWTGITERSSLEDNMCIMYMLPFNCADDTDTTLNLTLSGGSTTGAKEVHCISDNDDTVFYNVRNKFGMGSLLQLIYKTSITVGEETVANSWWVVGVDSSRASVGDVENVNDAMEASKETIDEMAETLGVVEETTNNLDNLVNGEGGLEEKVYGKGGLIEKSSKELVAKEFAKTQESVDASSLELGFKADDWKVKITNKSISLQNKGKDAAIMKPNDERENEAIFRIDTSRLANLYFRSADGFGKLGIVAQSNGHISLKEI